MFIDIRYPWNAPLVEKAFEEHDANPQAQRADARLTAAHMNKLVGVVRLKAVSGASRSAVQWAAARLHHRSLRRGWEYWLRWLVLRRRSVRQARSLHVPRRPPYNLAVVGAMSLPSNLPKQSTSFVGRDRELEALDGLLGVTSLLTLTGSGGCGKTRLALQLATRAGGRFPDGIWWVELAPLTSPTRVEAALASALGVRPLPGRTPLDAAIADLATDRALVLLDNCEHVLEQCRLVVAVLLRHCDYVTVVATSREPLGLGGETTWRVPSLSLPSPQAYGSARSLESSDAARLFVERARKVRPSFEITDATAPRLAEICAALDGIPLAIELAAARARMLSTESIASGLADRFHLLTGGARDELPRLQTLRASVDWSHDLLSADERMLLRRCGVFHGGFTLDACEGVCAADDLDPFLVLDVLTSLVDKSLVQVEEMASTTRYVMLETIRQYALERLEEAGEIRVFRDRHAEAFLAFAEAATPTLGSDIDSEDLLAADSANLSAAIDHTAGVDPESALRLCSALAYWWLLTGQLVEGMSALTRALDASTSQQSQLRGAALFWRGYLAFLASDYESAEADSTEALPFVRESGDRTNEARVFNTLGLLESRADPQAALSTLERACELAREGGDDWCLAEATQNLGWARLLMGDYDEARVELEASFAISQPFGWRELEAWHWWMLGHAVHPSGDRAAVRVMWEHSLDLVSDIQLGPVTWSLSLLDIEAGDTKAAIDRLASSREIVMAGGAGVGLQFLDAGFGLAHAACGDLEMAREMLTAAALEHSDGYFWTRAMTLIDLAKVELLRGDEAAALTHTRHALEVAHRLGHGGLASRARRVLARLAISGRDWASAEQHAHSALGAHVERGDLIEIPETLDVLAEIAIALENDHEAARLIAGSNRARADLGLERWTLEQELADTLVERLRARLGVPQLEVALADGASLALDDVVSYARRARGERKRPSAGWESLTPTELQIVRLAAAGLTNPEIAERMFIARGTVKVHLSHVYTKLGLRNRSEVAAEVARRSVTEPI